MKFTRPRVITKLPVVGSFDVNGNPTYTESITSPAVSDLILGNGSSSFDVLQKDGSHKSITSIALPAAYNDNATFEVKINGNTQIFVTINTVDLGAAALSGVKVLIEFADPDHPGFWIPSKKGVNRESSLSVHEWSVLGVGNKVVVSREEHKQFKLARVRFRANTGAADADTKIICSWHHNGGRSQGEIFTNDPSSVI